MHNKIRVLVIDDSPLVQQIIATGLSQDPVIEVVGTAADPYQARDRIIALKPDVLTLDVEMPRMNGLEFLKRLIPQYPIPVVMVSALTERGRQITISALEAGAVDFVTKPSGGNIQALHDMLVQLKGKIKVAATVKVSPRPKGTFSSKLASHEKLQVAGKAAQEKIIAIGASIGGTEAIKEVVTKFPSNMPGVIIVQHMPAGFTRMYADRLNQLCAMEVKEAESGDTVVPGRVLIAPGGLQMKLVSRAGSYQVICQEGEKVSGHCPSVDVMMHSVARVCGKSAIGVMLTGMGSDGATGMRAMHDAGSKTFAQDEKTSFVFGMPKAAYERGGVDELLPLDKIASTVIGLL